MKVAMIAKKDEYGMYAHISHLINELSKIPEIELHVIYLIYEANAAATKSDRFANYTLHYVNCSKNKLGFMRGVLNVLNIKKKILEVNPEIIHVQSVMYFVFAPILLRYKYPVICTIHSLVAMDIKMAEWAGYSEYINRKMLSLIERKVILKRLPNIIILAHPLKELIPDRCNANVYIIPNGVDLDDIQDTYHKQLEHPSILYVGRLTNIKGVDVLLKAISIIKRSIPNLSLYVIGEGPQEDDLKRLVKKLNIEENVKFLGFVSGAEKYAYFKSADVFVLPSRHESAPVVLPEAMACKKPIIASNVGGIPFMVEDGKTGLLVDPGNADEFAEKIIMLLENEQLREKMGKAGREKIKNFTWDKIAQQTVEVYERVIKNHELRKGKKRLKNLL